MLASLAWALWCLAWPSEGVLSVAPQDGTPAPAPEAAGDVQVSRRDDLPGLIGRLRAERQLAELRTVHQRARAGALEAELRRVSERSFAREWELLQRQQLLVSNGANQGIAAGLAQILGDLTEAQDAEAQGAETSTPEVAAEPSPLAGALQRGTELRRVFNGLLRTEGVGGLELLEAGVPWALDPRRDEAEAFGTGPVVFRRLDASGRLLGGLAAERLTLEQSRSGRTLSLILHRPEERIRGQLFLMDQEVLRIDLDAIDSEVFRDLCPELFAPTSVARLLRRPFRNRTEMQVRFQELLEQSRSGERYQLQSVGGRDDEAWLDVRFLARDSGGRPDRHLLADRMFLGLRDGLVVLELLDGATVIGGRPHVPFLNGRMRIVLADADPDAWIDAGLPCFRQLDPEQPDAEGSAGDLGAPEPQAPGTPPSGVPGRDGGASGA